MSTSDRKYRVVLSPGGSKTDEANGTPAHFTKLAVAAATTPYSSVPVLDTVSSD